MRKFVMAALGGTVAGAILTTQLAGPLIAQETEKTGSVYEQLDLFGDMIGRLGHLLGRQDVESFQIAQKVFGIFFSLNGM